MRKVFYIFSCLLTALLIFFGGGKNHAEVYAPEQSSERLYQYSGYSSLFHKLQSAHNEPYKWKGKSKFKIKIRYRARYCHFDLIPVPEVEHSFFVVKSIGYAHSDYSFSNRSLFSFQLRGPPSI